MASRVKQGVEEVQKSLETMAKKGIVFSMQHGGRQIYNLFPLIPGVIENRLLTGVVDERARKMARLVTEYISILNRRII